MVPAKRSNLLLPRDEGGFISCLINRKAIRQVYQGYANLGLKRVPETRNNFQFAVNNQFIEGYIGLAETAILENNLTRRYQQVLGVYNHLIAK